MRMHVQALQHHHSTTTMTSSTIACFSAFCSIFSTTSSLCLFSSSTIWHCQQFVFSNSHIHTAHTNAASSHYTPFSYPSLTHSMMTTTIARACSSLAHCRRARVSLFSRASLIAFARADRRAIRHEIWPAPHNVSRHRRCALRTLYFSICSAICASRCFCAIVTGSYDSAFCARRRHA
jgi:hypothetical protein